MPFDSLAAHDGSNVDVEDSRSHNKYILRSGILWESDSSKPFLARIFFRAVCWSGFDICIQIAMAEYFPDVRSLAQ